MDAFITDKLINLLLMGTTFSVFEMAFIQKLKMLPIFNKDYKVWILNFISSFALGIPFMIHFFEITITDAVWVSFFGFIGAPTIYTTLKKQNLINYKPRSVSNNVSIPKNNEIKR